MQLQPMRYSNDHKATSRAAILESARSLFRRQGFKQTSLDQVMEGASLTRGTFYAHFSSKQDLHRAAMQVTGGLQNDLDQAAASTEALAGTRAALLDYLAVENQTTVGQECPMIAHASDAIRGDQENRDDYARHVAAAIASIDSALGGHGPEPTTAAVQLAIATIGGSLLAIATAGTRVSAHIRMAALAAIETHASTR